MAATIFLVRHGSHDEVGRVLSGRSGILLNERGREQARRAGARLAACGVDAVWSSPRPRAIETAGIVARTIGCAIEIVDGLDEIDFGCWTGRAFADLDSNPAWQRWNAARGVAATPAGETIAQVAARAVARLETIGAARRIACVSHCDVIRAIVAHVIGLDGDRLLSFDCDPGSVTRLQLWRGGGRLLSLNECG